MGITAAMMVVAKAELAQSYMIQPRTARLFTFSPPSKRGIAGGGGVGKEGCSGSTLANPPHGKIRRQKLLFLAGSGSRGMSKNAFRGRMGGDEGGFRRKKITVDIKSIGRRCPGDFAG